MFHLKRFASVPCFIFLVSMLVSPASAATRTWIGSVSGYWTNAANWQGSLAPNNGDDVVFPDSATRKAVTNTLTSLSVDSITFSGSNYVLQGLGSGVILTIAADLVSQAPGTNLVQHRILFGGGTTIENTVAGSVLELKSHLPTGSSANLINIVSGNTFKGAGDIIVNHLRLLDDPTQTLAKEGSGTLTFRGTAAGHIGVFDVKAGRMDLENAVFDSTTFTVRSNATLSGNGQVANVFMELGGILEASDSQLADMEITTEAGFAGRFRTVLSGFTPQSGLVRLTGALGTGSNVLSLEITDGGLESPLTGQSFLAFEVTDGSQVLSTNTIFGLPITGRISGIGEIFSVNLRGGAGSNDIIFTHLTNPPPAAATRTWQGISSGIGNWRTGTNWVGATIPAHGDNLVFPADASGRSLTNDFINSPYFGELRFGAPNFVIRGEPFALTGGINVSNAAAARFRAPVSLAADQTFRNDDTLIFFDTLNIWNRNLTLLGSGQTEIQGGLLGGFNGVVEKNGTGTLLLSGANTYNGKMIFNRGLTVSDAIFPSAVGGAKFSVTTNGTLQLTGGNIPGLISDGGTVLLDAAIDSTGGVRLTNAVVRWDLAANPGLTVNGSVILSGTTLELTNSGATITAFSSFTNILGLGTRTGTYTGLPDNSVITYDTNRFLLRYTGPSSNHIVIIPLGGITNYTWDGSGTTGSWLNRTNWVGDATIGPEAILNFPPGAARTINTNGTIAITTFYNAINYTGSNYTSYGIPVILSGGVTNSALGGTNTIAFDLIAGAPLTFNTTDAATHLDGDIDLRDLPLDIRGGGLTRINGLLLGTGTVTKYNNGTLVLTGDDTFKGFDGEFVVEQGTLQADGQYSNFALTNGVSLKVKSGATLTGNGTMGNITVRNGGRAEPGTNGGGDLTVHGMVFNSGSTAAFNVNFADNSPAFNNQIRAQYQTLDLGNATLELHITAEQTSGSRTLVFANTSGQIVGEFAGYPHGSVFAYSNRLMRVIYSNTTVSLENLSLNGSATTRIWNGNGGAPPIFSDATNWSTLTVPANGANLLFPSTATSRTITNDLNLTINQLRFDAPNYEIWGPETVLLGGINVSNSAGARLHFPLVLGSNQIFQVANLLRCYDAIKLFDRTLTVSGLGETRFDGAVTGSGSIVKNGGGSILFTEANIGNFTANNGTVELSSITDTSPLPLVTSGDINLTAGVTLLARFGVDNTPATAPIQAAGNFDPAGATFTIEATYGALAGDVLVLATSGTPITTTFAGLPEGGTIIAGGVTWQISYAANSGKRITLTAQNNAPVPPVFTSIQRLGISTVRLHGTGASNVPVVIEASTNLVDWSDLATRPVADGTFLLNDTNSPAVVRRFYRARIQ